AHVSIWSDLSVPVFNFNVYLTGYDTERINMRDVLNGILPRTASAGQDPSDAISPHGSQSQDINFASCAAIPNSPTVLFSSFSLPPPAKLTAAQISNMQLSLTGQPAGPAPNENLCAGTRSALARGYITVDLVNNCTGRFPSDPGYFVLGGGGDATNQNNITG